MSSFQEHLLQELKDPKMALEYILEALLEPGPNNSYLFQASAQVAKAHDVFPPKESIVRKYAKPCRQSARKILRSMGIQA